MALPKVEFSATNAGIEAYDILHTMSLSDEYITPDSYTPHSAEEQTFVEKHMQYLHKHPSTDSRQYVSNLKIMCRKR